MTLTPELKQLIEQEMNGLTKDDYLRPGMSYDDFITEFSSLLAQEKEDEVPLTGAGFNASAMPKYYGYMDMIVQEHGARIVSELETKQSREEFDSKMPEAKKDKKLLMAVGRYVITRTEKREDKKVYDLVRKGRGDMDTLQDNITMASFLRKHKDLAQEVKPGGKSVDDKYLDSVEQKALGLIKLRGEVAADGDDSKEQVDRQNRLMTLCINAQREIKLFAEMAFYDDTERYNRFYASDAIRQQRTDAAKNQGPPQV